jgi:histidinol phosphatase-like enzyme (inositol monophosphatase family)
VLPASDLEALQALAERIADETGQMLRADRKLPRGAANAFDTKDDSSPVTELDRRIEARMREMIGAAFPGHGILGEEFAPDRADAEFVWVIDPIDGTKQFIAGVPVYGTLISVTRAGTPVVGIIDHPITGERWAGAAGRPTTLNGQPVRARTCARLSDALMSCSNPETIGPGERAGFERVRAATKWRIYGASCYAYASLAAGRIDLSVDSGGHREVDYCALVPVIEGAGGVITDWSGRPLTIRSGNSLVAAGDRRRHAEALSLLRDDI